MELSRLFRILRARWRIVALIGAAGFASAFGLTALATGDVAQVFEASIPFEFELQGEETVEDLANEIQSERSLATFAAQDILANNPASIVADTTSARLVFYAHGSSRDAARALAQELVDAYLASDPSGGGDIGEQLAEMEAQAEQIEAEIAALQPDLSPEEEALKSRHELLDLQIANVRQEIVALTVADAGATSEQQAANEVRRQDLGETLQTLEAEKALLPPPPSGGLSPGDQLKLEALQRRMELLRLDYQRLALRTMGVTGEGNQQPTTVVDLTPEPPNPFLNGATGLFGGLGVALLALVVTSRARKEIWLDSDLPMPLLGSIPSRRAPNRPGPPWYDSIEGGRRKESIQALRTAIEGGLVGPGTALAIVGDKVDSTDCHTLAVDLGAAMASAGRRVLVVDADYATETDLTEFNLGDPGLDSVLALPIGSENGLRERISSVLAEVIQIRPGLWVIPSGPRPMSPADALAGHQFRVFLDGARQSFDLVVVVAGRARSPSAQVVAQRAGSALTLVVSGRSTIPSLSSLSADYDNQRVMNLGAVLAVGPEPLAALRDSGGSPRFGSAASDHKSTAPESLDSSVSRLRFYPSPMERGSGLDRVGSLRTLVGDLSEAGGEADDRDAGSGLGDELGSDVLAVLSATHRDQAYEPVSEYVVARVEDFLTAVSGQASLSDELVNVVIEDGFIPLTPVRGYRTAGDWLTEELRWELGNEQGDRVAMEFASVLGGGGLNGAAALDGWLIDEFFKRHVDRSEGEPEVWHITSEGGTAQVLAYGRRLNRDRLMRLNTHVVRRALDELQRELNAANAADNFDEAAHIETKLRDLHLFEVALGMLQVGSSEEARLRYPWRRNDQQPNGWAPIWSEGVRPNIAPLQRLHLLPEPVLTEDEMRELAPTG
jgi:hypothetical protein